MLIFEKSIILVIPALLAISLVFEPFQEAIIFSIFFLAALKGVFKEKCSRPSMINPLLIISVIALIHALAFDNWDFSALLSYLSLLFFLGAAGYAKRSRPIYQEPAGNTQTWVPLETVSIILFTFIIIFLVLAGHVTINQGLWLLTPFIPVLISPRAFLYPGVLTAGFFMALAVIGSALFFGSFLCRLIALAGCIFSYFTLAKAKRIEKWIILIFIIILIIPVSGLSDMFFSTPKSSYKRPESSFSRAIAGTSANTNLSDTNLSDTNLSNTYLSDTYTNQIKIFYDTAVSTMFSGTGPGSWTASLLNLLDTKNPGTEKESVTLSPSPPLIFKLPAELGIAGLISLLFIFYFIFTNFSQSITEKAPFFTSLRFSAGLMTIYYFSGFPQASFAACLCSAWFLIALDFKDKKSGPPLFFGITFTAGLVILILIWTVTGQTDKRARNIIRSTALLGRYMELDNYLPEKAKIHSAAIEECFAGGMIKKDVPLKAYPALASYLYSKDNISYAADLFDLSPANAFTPENMITAGRCFLENQVPSKAFKWFKGAYYLSFNKAEAAKELAGFYKSIGQPRQGLELIENLEKGRLFKELILIKAELCENLFLFDRAAEIYASGFSLFNNPFFLARAGQACVKNKNFLKAMDYFKMAHFQGDTKAPYRYVEAAVKEGLYAGAQDFIEKNPENFVTNESDLKRLELVLRQEDAAGVLTALKEAVSKNAPDEVKKLKQQIRQLDQAARYDSAIKLIDTYLSNGGSDPVLRLTRADLLLKSKRPLEAAEAWLEVLPDVKLTDQGLFKFYQKVAMAYSEAKKHEDAIKYAEKSISLTDGNNVEALNNLARVYGFAGEHKKAEKVLVHASNIAPDSQVTYFNLAMSYYSRNMAESAQRAVKQGLKYGKDGNYTEKLQELLKHLKTFRVVPAAPPKEVIDEKQE